MSHYYDKDPEVASQREDFKYRYQQNELKLATDSGVFSKGKIDYGSDLLLRTFLKEHPPGPSKTIIDVGCGYGHYFLWLNLKHDDLHLKVLLYDAEKLLRSLNQSVHIRNQHQ